MRDHGPTAAGFCIGVPGQVLLDGDRRAGRERSIDAVAPPLEVGVAVVGVHDGALRWCGDREQCEEKNDEQPGYGHDAGRVTKAGDKNVSGPSSARRENAAEDPRRDDKLKLRSSRRHLLPIEVTKFRFVIPYGEGSQRTVSATPGYFFGCVAMIKSLILA
jgi:hypothetical protein